ncbi:apoptosis regulator BAX-like isoform X2 [Lineus longissimus]|uniref:apoptosis regulator BAX-like isoform X2 n=1 Tax=Lineus longissimus TaxID=88925 RepID=UPI002B4F2472
MDTASGGGDFPDHPLGSGGDRGRPRIERSLSRHDVGNQARYLLNQFIQDRMRSGGYPEVPSEDVLIEPGTPAGPPIDRIREVAEALRVIGDELDQDQRLQGLIDSISPDAPRQTFMNVAREIFSDGVFNWGRVVALFYFAFRMVVKAFNKVADKVPLIRTIIDWVVCFIVDYVAPWIIERGGWSAIQEYFGSTTLQTAAVFVGGGLCSLLFIWWKNSK